MPIVNSVHTGKCDGKDCVREQIVEAPSIRFAATKLRHWGWVFMSGFLFCPKCKMDTDMMKEVIARG